MIKNKKIEIIKTIARIIIVFAIGISIIFLAKNNQQEESTVSKTEEEYGSKIFGVDIISIDILADESDWQEMLDNAAEETYIMVDVVVNGTTFTNVGIRPKGNSSLRDVASSDSDRYSFRLKFDEYVDGQTCFGLDEFVINNMYSDNTYMKEYISYEMLKEMGVDAPYFGYSDIKVNGENWGLYLAVEMYNESYEQRVFDDSTGMMYSVKMTTDDAIQPEKQMANNLETDELKGTGGSLEYSDGNTESYPDIFENVVGKGTDSDFQRVVTALEALSENDDLETYFDIDQILRYLAVHTFTVNLDSYSSNMAQNYYLYEKDGKITILPWDYNQGWGGFQMESASAVINFPIDTPVSGVEMSARPLIEKLFSNTDYLELYHDYLQEAVQTYFADNQFEEKVNAIDTMISEYVENDVSAFCTFEEYEIAVSSFKTLGNLRAESIQGQLDGTVPSTTMDQSTNSEQLISAGDLNLADLSSSTGGKKVEQVDKESQMLNPEQPTEGEITDQPTGVMREDGQRPPMNGDTRPDVQEVNNTNTSVTIDQGLNTESIILYSVLSFILVGVIVFVFKIKKNY